MPDDLNPYASPAIIPHDHAPQPVDPLGPLRGPSLGLFLSSGLVITLSVFFLVPELLNQIRLPRQNFPDSVYLLPMFLASFPILIGAWNMRFGTRYRWAYAAAVLASIPIITPGFWCGAPLGIWALVVLHRQDVKEEFARIKNLENRSRIADAT